MSLAEKIGLIDQERRRVEDQFNTELMQGLTQYHAMKTKEETDTRNEEIRQQGIDRTTITGTEEIKRDSGSIKTTTYQSGRKREDVTIDETTPEVEDKFKFMKSGNDIVMVDEEGNAEVVWNGEDLKKARATKNSKIVIDLKEQVSELRVKIAGYRQEIASARPEVDGDRKGIMVGTKFYPVEQITTSINVAMGKIRELNTQIEKESTKIDKKIEKKTGKKKEDLNPLGL